MSQGDEELKKRLMGAVEEVIEWMLATQPGPDEITLQEAEQAAVVTGEKLKEVLIRYWVENHREHPQAVNCPDCGRRLGLKDYRSRQVVTVAGEVKVRRAYYYCAECRGGIFPP